MTRPCEVCLEACHNGHFWMFHSEGLLSRERKDPVDSSQTMMWGTIPNPLCEEEYPRVCWAWGVSKSPDPSHTCYAL